MDNYNQFFVGYFDDILELLPEEKDFFAVAAVQNIYNCNIMN